LRQFALRVRQPVHFEVQLPQIFMRALVIGVARQRSLIKIERTWIVPQHAMRVAQVIQNIRVVRPLL